MMSRRTLIPLSLAVALVLLLTVTSAGAAPLEPLRVSFINVGQGDSTLLRSRDFAVLVDGGKRAASSGARARGAAVDTLELVQEGVELA